MTDGLDRSVSAEFLAEAADADLDDIRPRIEVEAPDLGEEPLAADHFTLVLDQMMENAKLAVRELRRQVAELRLAPCEVEGELARAHDMAVVAVYRPPELHADAGEELVERERLADVVRGAEPETAELRR